MRAHIHSNGEAVRRPVLNGNEDAPDHPGPGSQVALGPHPDRGPAGKAGEVQDLLLGLPGQISQIRGDRGL